MYTRRDFGKAVLASLPLASAVSALPKQGGKLNSKYNGVQIGAITYCYRAFKNDFMPLTPSKTEKLIDLTVEAYVEDGLNCCEFWVAFIEPYQGLYTSGYRGRTTELRPGGAAVSSGPEVEKQRQLLRDWRKSRPLEVFRYARKKFNDAGIDIYCIMYNFADDCTPDELEFAFDIANAMGTKLITGNGSVPSMKMAAPFADKHKMWIGAHNHNFANDPNDLGSVASLEKTLSFSPYMKITLDIGHATAANVDSVEFIRNHPGRILALHVKDRYKNDFTWHNDQNTLEWGKGDTPIKEVLQLMKKEKYSFPALIEYEYPGKAAPVQEMKKCIDYMKAALA
jgi:sugar phosphate isomerase/epimerase